MNTVQNLPEAMIFDLDGTLFQTETVLIPAYNRLYDQLRAEGLFEGETPDIQRILGSLGMLLTDIWKRVMPEATLAARERANVLLLQYQLEELANKTGELYPKVLETLTTLHRKGIRLFVASNGLEGYVKGVVAAKGLDHLFEGLYSAGEYQTQSKVDLVRMLLVEYDLQSAWMVGDRSSDVEAGKENQLFVVGCSYADFGNSKELDEADIVIGTFGDLLKLTAFDPE
ncbi:HAD family hydrolase [Paenibacillus psychroresistens]|uniref:HAD family hydrolase n=1 Tax=Paenibacillus psychroresistens TaxID=1778678 RepID=A0A6B8RM79_9BACL|nr:HAD hydrolase-like protein [Paenibacillus psychroresistens]QGQ97410.1 HAD family hydrolase [Paenibacillus psychroresistens]